MYVPMPIVIAVGVLLFGLLLIAVRPRRDGKGWQDGDDLLRAPPRQPAPPFRAAAPAPVDRTGALTAEGTAEVATLLRDGQVIMAVKRVRELTGLGLAEAKAIVDDMR